MTYMFDFILMLMCVVSITTSREGRKIICHFEIKKFFMVFLIYFSKIEYINKTKNKCLNGRIVHHHTSVTR
jgi:hypothetical protein